VSRLSRPTRTSVTQGFVLQSFAEIGKIFDTISLPLPHSAQTTECLCELKLKLVQCNGDFKLTLPEQTCLGTPFFPRYQTIQVAPFLSNLWRVTLGDGLVNQELHRAIGKPVISMQEQIKWRLLPIPNSKGVRAFSPSLAATVLRASQFFNEVKHEAGGAGHHLIFTKHQGEVFTVNFQVLGSHVPMPSSSLPVSSDDLVQFDRSYSSLKKEFQPQFSVTVCHAGQRKPFSADTSLRVQEMSYKLQSLTLQIIRAINDSFGRPENSHQKGQSELGSFNV
jgi:hypothetical protein